MVIWEKIETTESIYGVETHRLKVPNGWIVRSILITPESSSINSIFVLDADHIWKINN